MIWPYELEQPQRSTDWYVAGWWLLAFAFVVVFWASIGVLVARFA
jgi:hypothetical protein